MNCFEQLKKFSALAIDTADLKSIKPFSTALSLATTNPSLISAAALDPTYHDLVKKSIEFGKKNASSSGDLLSLILDKLSVGFGVHILQLLAGPVSTEIDPRLSFDTKKTIERARRIISLYEEQKIPRQKVLIKIAATWEGILAAHILEKEGIACNVTIVLSPVQALAAAQQGASMIACYVARIADWYAAQGISTSAHPGVSRVSEIHHLFKKEGYKTKIMAASFRSPEEVYSLAGCDILTVQPKVLQEMQQDFRSLEQKLPSKVSSEERVHAIDEPFFRWSLCEDAMASCKLDEAIRRFSADTVSLEKQIQKQL